mmetsp:Transcript_24754/g.68956  ORF Transcript_24754/g.68956 Transcript_24754/m.68956 type:complete len:247 (+) Transcript_24754:386-1126(+)
MLLEGGSDVLPGFWTWHTPVPGRRTVVDCWQGQRAVPRCCTCTETSLPWTHGPAWPGATCCIPPRGGTSPARPHTRHPASPRASCHLARTPATSSSPLASQGLVPNARGGMLASNMWRAARSGSSRGRRLASISLGHGGATGRGVEGRPLPPPAWFLAMSLAMMRGERRPVPSLLRRGQQRRRHLQSKAEAKQEKWGMEDGEEEEEMWDNKVMRTIRGEGEKQPEQKPGRGAAKEGKKQASVELEG